MHAIYGPTRHVLLQKLLNLFDSARLGRVIPLGQLRSVYKSDVECLFLCRNGQMTWSVKVNASYFQYQLTESQDAYLAQICGSSSNL